jgi:flagellar basal body-associated protein FliL
MNLTSILTIVAIAVGPILAVQIQKYLERKKEAKNRKIQIFKSLMATRGAVLSATHVEALNRIDLEFSDDKKYKKIIEAWKEYFDNLSNRKESKDEIKIWAARNEELLANLLFEMGNSLGFSFDKVLIKRNIYSPQAHADIELENTLIRRGIIRLLTSETSLPVTNVVDEENLKKQLELQELLLNYYKNKEPINVRIIGNGGDKDIMSEK